MVANYGGPMRLFEAAPDGRTVLDKASEAVVALTTGGRALVSGPIISSRTDIFANNEGYASGGRQLEAEPETALLRQQPAEMEEEAEAGVVSPHGTFSSISSSFSTSIPGHGASSSASIPARRLGHTPTRQG